MAETPGRQTIGGAGAATSAGILFQKQIGAIIGAWLVAEQPFDQRLDLGAAKPVWLRFETEAPVDDILVGTSTGGFVAVQAKTTASLSREIGSPFGKTVSQFVRHWLACREGDGSLRWNRPLDARVDRLVLAVGPQAPVMIREVLPAALRLKAQPGGGELNDAQRRAFADFEACVEQAWSQATALPYEPATARDLAALISVVAFDPVGLARQAVVASLVGMVASPADAAAVLSALEALCGELMAQRGGVDLATVRRKLMGRGISLRPPPDFRRDIERLMAHSTATAATLERFEVIEVVEGDRVTIGRECQDAVRGAAIKGDLLIVGEPGAGKSGVLNALARDLRLEGRDVVELAVDRYSVDTLEGLRQELGLTHGVVETLKAWDDTEPAWLIIDALDATRGGRGEGVFRTLIEQVMASGGRWNVIASIRTFDLRMGQQFRTLFKGTPPVEGMMEPGFPAVRHVRVPSWTQSEFAQLLARAPVLAAALANAPRALQDLAAIPFNTRLVSDLVKDGVITSDFSHIATQSELLQLYWEHRVERYAAPARACILRIVTAMVEARALRASFAVAAQSDASALDDLEREGVLISVDNRRWIQFRHHLLFDFAAARIMLDPEELIQGDLRFGKAEARGLMLAPALSFVLREIWMREPDRAEFWTAAGHILSDRDGDPVIRSATGRICAEYPLAVSDMKVLAGRIVAGDEEAAQAFVHSCGALVTRLEDFPETSLTPWVGLVLEIAPNVAPVAGTLRFLLFRIVESVEDAAQRKNLGIAARALLEYSLGLEQPRNAVSAAVDLVAETYGTDVMASRTLLAKILTPERLTLHAAEEVPALCRKIEQIGTLDPAFTELIYQKTYGFDVIGDQETMMGDSQIMPFRSNSRQDYAMARYSLSEFFETFLELHPSHAVSAVVQATEAYVVREHSRIDKMLNTELEVAGRRIRLREDWSHIWAHDPDKSYGHDAESLVKKLLNHLRCTETDAAVRIAERLIQTASLAIFWSRLFLVATEREDSLAGILLPIAMQEDFLTLPDTRKDAVGVVAKGYPGLEEAVRSDFEEAVGRFDFSRYQRPDEARASFERRLFGAIGPTNLATERARRIAGEQGDIEDVQNDRLFTVRATMEPPEPYYWIQGLDQNSPANRKLIGAIEEAKQALGTEGDALGAVGLEAALDAMKELAALIDRDKQNPHLVIYAEGQISQALIRLVERKILPSPEDDAATTRFLEMFSIAEASAGPRVEEDTETDFERGASWGSPAPRVDAAQMALDIVLQRPDLYPDLEPAIDLLLNDRHPAVRLQALLRIVRIWHLDRNGFWRRLSARLSGEGNQSVIDHVSAAVLGRVVHEEPEKVETLALALLERFNGEPARQARMRDTVSDLLAILWVTHERRASLEVVASWIAEPAAHSAEILKILRTLRGALIAGLKDQAVLEERGLRHRSQKIASEVVLTANRVLKAYYENDRSAPEQSEKARDCALLLDAVCMELFFAAGAGRDTGVAEGSLRGDAMATFFDEVSPTLQALGDFATPQTVYYLIQLLEFLLPANPARTFDLTVHALRSGGRRTGYQFESLGADLLVRLVGVFLADHKELFDDDARRAALIDCLEIFMEAGWPAARRLLYRLPELIQ
ncbi:conserved hypothetical protein (plasmid) [Rhizobium leguminosarum bv. trifolii WSM2304]|uniref:ATP-binding protein n=1 Tax=Rhizobium leguminosarum bv. trifolii (strain WSM2304) TaxID=395492 RepID=A0ABF7QXJ5_RHILW|nr:ATP-binding protein [Rhizobium leguminosarum]ACI58859.1 conserved hypothetical protein [Rhizobium leguminosarum bv. trifolii WSM2304]